MKTATSSDTPILWGPLRGSFFTVLVFVLSQVVIALATIGYGAVRHWTVEQTQNWISASVNGQFLIILLAEIVTVGLIYWFVKHHKQTLRVIGLKRARVGDVIRGVVAYVPYFVVFALISQILYATNAVNTGQSQDIGFNSVHGPWQLTLTFISLVVLPPLAEEIMFRGLLFSSLRSRLRWRYAAVITSLLFAAGHLLESGDGSLLYIAGIDTFILSLVLCYLRERTGSLWAGITLHALKNGVAYVSLFILAGR